MSCNANDKKQRRLRSNARVTRVIFYTFENKFLFREFINMQVVFCVYQALLNGIKNIMFKDSI